MQTLCIERSKHVKNINKHAHTLAICMQKLLRHNTKVFGIA